MSMKRKSTLLGNVVFQVMLDDVEICTFECYNDALDFINFMETL